jgi:hypothetical protein
VNNARADAVEQAGLILSAIIIGIAFLLMFRSIKSKEHI